MIKGSFDLVVYSDDDKKKLITCLGACMAVQRTYGKQAQELGEVVKVFEEVLCEYPAVKVAEAIRSWMLKSPEFPTPADIAGILNPQPRFDYQIYSRISHELKAGGRVTDDEKDYLKAYEQNAMKGL